MASTVLEQQWLDRIQSLEESLRNCRETLETATGPKTKYDFVLEGTSEGLMLLDCNHQISDVNQALLWISGYRRSELIGRSVLALYDKDAMVFHSASPDHLKFEAPLKSRYGRQIPMLFSRSIFRDKRGEIAGYMIFLTDLTELKATQAELERAERRYRAMYENAVQAMFQSRLSGELIRVNPSYARIFGYESPEEVLALAGGAREFYFHPEDRQRMIRAVRKNGSVVNYELCLKRKDGKPVWILANVRLIRKSRRNAFLEGILVDNTKNKKLEEKLRRERRKFQNLSVRDNLTGLFNTRYLYRALDDLILQSNATGTAFSLLFMDMDNFKKVVDAHGHLNGSKALSEVARTIKASIRRPCFGVAYGGDEFVIVLPGFTKSRARRKAEHIRSRMKKTDYLESEGLRVKLSASIGLATFPDDVDNRTGLLALADKAMFRIKQHRKDAVGTVA
jgi:diguanylate cyclase (GGDEF)-like protein/PAS domain S-box-containing protein